LDPHPKKKGAFKDLAWTGACRGKKEFATINGPFPRGQRKRRAYGVRRGEGRLRGKGYKHLNIATKRGGG